MYDIVDIFQRYPVSNLYLNRWHFELFRFIDIEDIDFLSDLIMFQKLKKL
jgi:hypothetical protein